MTRQTDEIATVGLFPSLEKSRELLQLLLVQCDLTDKLRVSLNPWPTVHRFSVPIQSMQANCSYIEVFID